jgi:F-type H+-transporting ATPase subunit gamma
MRHAQSAALSGREYSFRLEELAERLTLLGDMPPLALLKKREIHTRGIVFVSTDKGLCGSLNQNTFQLLKPIAGKDVRYVAVGQKGAQMLTARRWPLLAEFSINDNVPFFQARALADFLRNSYLSGEIDSVEVVHPIFVNVLRQEPIWEKLLPFTDLAQNLQRRQTLLPTSGTALPHDPRELKVEPSLEELWEILLGSFFCKELYHIILESKAAEQSARMSAMKAATDNADALAKELQLSYNKARQSAITDEILEITASAERK